MKAVLLSGGTGSRLRPITHTGPKQLVPVANKPVLEYAIEDLRNAGITDIGVVLGNKGREEIQDYLGDGSGYGVDITYIIQGNALGLAHAAGCAQEFIGKDDFVMYLGDNILKQGISELVDSFHADEYGAGIALQRVDNPHQFGIADLDENGNVQELVEKPDNPPTDLALIGIYAFSNEVFDVIDRLDPSWRGELEITDAIQMLLEDGHSIDSKVIDGWWKDTGKPEDILEANRLVLQDNPGTLDGFVAEGASIEGHLDLDETARIEDGSVVRGPVSIAAGTTIESGTYVGPYTTVGPDSTISRVHIENSVIVGESEIVTNKKIVDSLIGQGTTIGNAEDMLPEGRRLVVGENSDLKL